MKVHGFEFGVPGFKSMVHSFKGMGYVVSLYPNISYLSELFTPEFYTGLETFFPDLAGKNNYTYTMDAIKSSLIVKK